MSSVTSVSRSSRYGQALERIWTHSTLNNDIRMGKVLVYTGSIPIKSISNTTVEPYFMLYAGISAEIDLELQPCHMEKRRVLHKMMLRIRFEGIYGLGRDGMRVQSLIYNAGSNEDSRVTMDRAWHNSNFVCVYTFYSKAFCERI